MKPVILVFIQCYLPGFRAGGPLRSIANLVARFGDEFDFRIVCTDREFRGERAYPGVEPDAWNTVGKAKVFYASERTLSLRGLWRLLRKTPHDALYLNSFFSPTFTIYPLLLRWLRLVPRPPVLVAPRGEFSPAALALKPLRKRAFITLTHVVRLYAAVRWQASSVDEMDDIARTFSLSRDRFSKARDLVAPLTDGTITSATADEPEGGGTELWPLRVCFLSRISPMKNLDFALRALRLVKTPVQFSIYGPIEDASYWGHCQELANALPPNVVVAYAGEVDPQEVVPTLASHDLFLFPTRGENFGHVIHEALRAGLLLLISDQTPWKGLEGHGVGWDLSLDAPAAFAEMIERVSGFSNEDRRRWSSRALAYAAEVGNDAGVLEDNRQMLLSLTASTVAAADKGFMTQGNDGVR